MLGSGVRAALLLTALMVSQALLWPGELAAQVTAAKEGAEQNSATHSLSGTVVNAITGAPVAHALVQMLTQAQRETSPGTVTLLQVPHATFTDENGQFSVELAGGQTPTLNVAASVHVFKPGYFSSDETPGQKPFVQMEGAQVEPVTCR